MRNNKVVCDLDGTVADNQWRTPFTVMPGETRPAAWNRWHKHNISLDKAIVPVHRLLLAFDQAGYEIIYATARPQCAREETQNWIRELGLPNANMLNCFMRADEDERPAHVIKREWAIGRLVPQEVLLVLEDEDACVQVWREEGYHVLHCRGAL